MVNLPKHVDPRVLVGLETSDDAGVYLLRDDLALVQTLDFFSPLTDDPYMFGQIAAANSLSDIYAMGAQPLTALNIACYAPCVPLSVMGEVLRGGADKIAEAGVALLGGHTVENADFKYGLSVTGVVDPTKIIKNSGAKPRDSIILTKPLGTGIISTAYKAGLVDESHMQAALNTMAELNKTAAEVFAAYEVHGGTDITGFGLLGHAVEVARASQVEIVLSASELLLLEGTLKYAAMGLIPAGAYRNAEHFGSSVSIDPAVPEALVDACYDPQTSGGLLFALPSAEAGLALLALKQSGVRAAQVGFCRAGNAGRVLVKQ
ncbi:MAG: Selenide, water dikinase [Firmicutes bacterium]|nr:Selenide, water dikinase [candidate division NPL-UPA2 bacterium]